MMTALESLGWEFCEAARLRDHNQSDVYLRTGDPKRLRKMLERRLEELHEQRVEEAVVKKARLHRGSSQQGEGVWHRFRGHQEGA